MPPPPGWDARRLAQLTKIPATSPPNAQQLTICPRPQEQWRSGLKTDSLLGGLPTQSAPRPLKRLPDHHRVRINAGVGCWCRQHHQTSPGPQDGAVQDQLRAPIPAGLKALPGKLQEPFGTGRLPAEVCQPPVQLGCQALCSIMVAQVEGRFTKDCLAQP